MIRQNFNDGWIFRKGSGGSLAALLLGESDTGERVRLPHDASVFLKRNPEDQMGNGNGYYQEICCHYTKEFEICNPENKTVWLEFDGVYQNAFVYVNQAFAGKCPYGYSRFFI